MTTNATAPELTLDPADWDALRVLGHRMVDDMLEYQRTLGERPAWQEVPAGVRQRLAAPVPRRGMPAEQVYEDFKRDVLPYPPGNAHPRFWGWVIGTGTPLGMLAELLAAGINPQLSGLRCAPRLVEEQVIAWLCSLMGLDGGNGLLLSGGSMANFVGVAVARQACAGFDVREQGLRAGPQLTFYGSEETHSSVRKAIELQGMGNLAWRRIPVDGEYRVNVHALRAAIRADRQGGCRPCGVVGNAGTVNTGAFDDLPALAELAREEKVWFHVDGAFGALAAWHPSLKPLVRGMDLADSIAFDLHKWGYLPFEAGCLLVRDAEHLRAAFSATPEYLKPTGIGPAGDGFPFADMGVQLSRGFRALKVWMALRTHGADVIGDLVHQNVEQARYVARRVEAEPDLELLAPVPLNVVCFRFAPAGLDDEARNRLNAGILRALQERGIAVPSHTILGGRYALRIAITNHRSRQADFDLLLDSVVALGRELLSGWRETARSTPHS